MKLLISRGNYARITAGMSPAEREQLDALVWRLVDADTGEVVDEGTLGPDLAEYIRVAQEAVDELVDDAGVPRDLLY